MNVEFEEPPSLYIGFTGGPGSGKTSIAKYFDSLSPTDLDPRLHNFIDIDMMPMRGLLRWHAQTTGDVAPITQEEMQTYHKQLRAQRHGHKIWEGLKALHGRIIIVDAIREPSDMKFFKERLGGLIVAMVAPLDVRKERFINDTNDNKHKTSLPGSAEREEAWHRANREMKNEKNVPGSSYIQACVDAADSLVCTGEDKKELVFPHAVNQITNLIRTHFGWERLESPSPARTPYSVTPPHLELVQGEKRQAEDLHPSMGQVRVAEIAEVL